MTIRGIPHGPRNDWTPEEDELLLELYRRGDARDLADLLGRTVSAVQQHFACLSGRRLRDSEFQRNADSREVASRHSEPWTEEEHALVSETLDEPVADVAYVLGRTVFAVQGRRVLVMNGEPVTFYERGEAVPRSLPTTRRQPADPGPLCSRCFTYHRGDCA